MSIRLNSRAKTRKIKRIIDTPMDVRAVIVDFGGVLYFPPDLQVLRRWQKFLGLKNDGLLKEFFATPGGESDYARRVFTGEISEAEVWKKLGSHWRISPWLLRYVRKRSFSKRRFNQPVANYIQSLRPRFQTAILSNAGDQDRQIFNEAYCIEDLVDTVIISAEVRLAKPDPRIYLLALERLGVQPEETIFVDDLQVNIAAARQLGIRAIQFQDNEQFFKEIKEITGIL